MPDIDKDRIANLAKVIAERDDRSGLPKIIIVGINNVGADLIQMVPDIAKRVGIHRVQPGTQDTIRDLIIAGTEQLNIEISNLEGIYAETRGDYWLTQQMCRTICLAHGVYEAVGEKTKIDWNPAAIFAQMAGNLEPTYDQPVKVFCRGRRFRPTNDPYFKLLKLVSEQERSSLDLTELANANPHVKGSINNVKDKRLSVLIAEKEECARYFYYDSQTKNFAVEDPALFFYIRHLDWEKLRERCGFRADARDFEFDVAISFAGENRTLAQFIAEQLAELDISVFYDRNFEDNFLGGAWSKYFQEIFVERSRLVVVLLDANHAKKSWPAFERDCFAPRVAAEEVVPVRLDDTVFAGIPGDINSIRYNWSGDLDISKDQIIDDIVLRIAAKLEAL